MTEKQYKLRFCEVNGNLISAIEDKDKIYTLKEIVDLLNKLSDENEQLKETNKDLRYTIKLNSQDDYIDFLEKQNEILKERIEELASNDKIVFIVNE